MTFNWNDSKSFFRHPYFWPGTFVLFLLVLPIVAGDPVFLHLVILVYFYAFLAMSWNILGGFAGQLSMGHAAFVAIGAYVSTLLLLRWNLSPWVGMFIGGFAASLVSVLIGYPCFKLRGAYYALATLAFSELVRVIITNTDTFLGFKVNGASGLLLPVKGNDPLYFQFIEKTIYYYIILIFCILLTLVIYLINNSRLGYYLAAIREDQDAAESLGINVTGCKLLAAMISAFFTGIGGVFYAQYVLFISAESIGGLHISFEMVFISIIGGKGTLFGPVVGAFLMTPLAELTRTYFGSSYMGLHLVLYGVVLMFVIKFIPSGIFFPLTKLYHKFIKVQMTT